VKIGLETGTLQLFNYLQGPGEKETNMYDQGCPLNHQIQKETYRRKTLPNPSLHHSPAGPLTVTFLGTKRMIADELYTMD
jgi:hypothetical protein